MVKLFGIKKDNWMFLISNIVALNGRVVNKNIVDRRNLIYKILESDYKLLIQCLIFVLYLKKIYKYSDYKLFLCIFQNIIMKSKEFSLTV